MYKSLLGSILTLLTIIFVALYAGYRWQILIDRDEARVTLNTATNYFEDSTYQGIGQKDGFKVAFSLFERARTTKLVDDPSYGSFKVIRKIADDQSDTNEVQTVKFHPCEPEDFNGDHSETSSNLSFYPVENQALINVTDSRELMQCIHDDELYIKGEEFSLRRESLQISWQSCLNTTSSKDGVVCKSPEEIKDWLLNKGIAVLQNEVTFRPNDFESPMKRSARFKFFSLFQDGNFDYPMHILRSRIRFSDSIFSIGTLLQGKEDGFKVVDQPSRPSQSSRFEPGGFTSTNIIYFHDSDLYEYSRTTYTILDYLKDIGGLTGAFNAIFTGIVFVLNFNGLYQWLTSKLFRVEGFAEYHARQAEGQANEDPRSKQTILQKVVARQKQMKVFAAEDKKLRIEKYQSMRWNIFSTLVLNIKRVPFLRKLFCRLSTSDRLFQRSFTKFTKEIEITSLIKSIRTLKNHAKRDFSKIQWRLYKLIKGYRRVHLQPRDDKLIENSVFKPQPFTLRRPETQPERSVQISTQVQVPKLSKHLSTKPMHWSFNEEAPYYPTQDNQTRENEGDSSDIYTSVLTELSLQSKPNLGQKQDSEAFAEEKFK